MLIIMKFETWITWLLNRYNRLIDDLRPWIGVFPQPEPHSTLHILSKSNPPLNLCIAKPFFAIPNNNNSWDESPQSEVHLFEGIRELHEILVEYTIENRLQFSTDMNGDRVVWSFKCEKVSYGLCVEQIQSVVEWSFASRLSVIDVMNANRWIIELPL